MALPTLVRIQPLPLRRIREAVVRPSPSICHDPADANPLTPPYPWSTTPPITQPGTWWVYPANGGKFAAGQLHVDVQVTGGTWSTSPGADRYILTGVTQWDGKAMKG